MKVTVELDVLPQRVPDRTVLVAGEVDGALNRLGGHSAGDDKVQRHAREATGLVFGARGDETGLQPAEIVSAPS